MASNWDDIVYVSLLILSIGLGPQLRKITEPLRRQQASALAGFLILLLVSGWAILHPLFVIVVNAIITLYLSKRNSHINSFVFCFAYLAFFRCCHLFGMPSPPPHTNAAQMILTLKMIGVTSEVRETFFRKNEEKKDLESQFLNVEPTFMDIFYYSFCHAGVLTGPYYTYRTYWDSFYTPYGRYANLTKSLVKRIRFVPLYVFLFIVFNNIFPLEYAESEEIFERSLWYRVWYMSPLFFVFRMRIYIGFILSECQCITNGIGVYPSESNPKPGQGPTYLSMLKKLNDEEDGKLLKSARYDHEAIHNIDEYGTEFGPSIKEALRGWNMTVQYWLVKYVYKKVPWKQSRVAITMLTSAFWHGVYPGYYLSLLTVPFFLVAETVMLKALIERNTSPLKLKICHFFGNFFKLQAFSYMGIGFFLLTASKTLNYWNSIYFLGHIFIVLFYVIGMSISSIKLNARKKEEKLRNIEKQDTKKVE